MNKLEEYMMNKEISFLNLAHFLRNVWLICRNYFIHIYRQFNFITDFQFLLRS